MKTPTRRRKPLVQKLVPPPVTAEFRAECHALMDKSLTDHPGTHAILIIVAGDLDVNCASLPNTIMFKRGCIDTMYKSLHPDDDSIFK